MCMHIVYGLKASLNDLPMTYRSCFMIWWKEWLTFFTLRITLKLMKSCFMINHSISLWSWNFLHFFFISRLDDNEWCICLYIEYCYKLSINNMEMNKNNSRCIYGIDVHILYSKSCNKNPKLNVLVYFHNILGGRRKRTWSYLLATSHQRKSNTEYGKNRTFSEIYVC